MIVNFKLLALLITKDLITQDEIDRLLTAFLKAQDQLNGKETDFMSLKNVIVDEVKFQDKDPRFLTAVKRRKMHIILFSTKLSYFWKMQKLVKKKLMK